MPCSFPVPEASFLRFLRLSHGSSMVVPAGSWPGFRSASHLVWFTALPNFLYYYRLSATLTKSCKLFYPSLPTLQFLFNVQSSLVNKGHDICSLCFQASGFIGFFCLKAFMIHSTKAAGLSSLSCLTPYTLVRLVGLHAAAWIPAIRVWRWTRSVSLPSAKLCSQVGWNKGKAAFIGLGFELAVCSFTGQTSGLPPEFVPSLWW